MDLTCPEVAKVQKVLSEGECEFWDVSSPGFAPNPFCFPFWFWGFFFGSFWSVWSVAFAALLRFGSSLCCFLCCSMHNACVTIHGGSEARHLTPPLGLLSPLSLRFLGFGLGTVCPRHAPDAMCRRTVSTPPLLSGSRENHGPNDRSGEATVLSHKCCGRR